jgi:hypothetical protein
MTGRRGEKKASLPVAALPAAPCRPTSTHAASTSVSTAGAAHTRPAPRLAALIAPVDPVLRDVSSGSFCPRDVKFRSSANWVKRPLLKGRQGRAERLGADGASRRAHGRPHQPLGRVVGPGLFLRPGSQARRRRRVLHVAAIASLLGGDTREFACKSCGPRRLAVCVLP